MRIYLALSIVFIVGCDSVGGIRHQARIDNLPPSDCVLGVLGEIENISGITYKVEEGSRPITFTGIKPPEMIHRFFYSIAGLESGFYFVVNYDGKIEYNHSYMYLNSNPPQSEIDTIHPVMESVEELLVQNCGLTNLKENMEKYCTSGINCT